MRTGQTHVHKYMDLMRLIEEDKVDPTVIIRTDRRP